MAQQIRELMTPNPVVLPGTASVHEAARAMRDAQIGDVIVIENNQVCGIVTDRDIVVRTVAETQDPATTTLADICSHQLTHRDAHGQRRGGGAAHAHPCHSPLAGGRRGAGGGHCVARGSGGRAGSGLGAGRD